MFPRSNKFRPEGCRSGVEMVSIHGRKGTSGVRTDRAFWHRFV